jgi:hypothetical protein
MALQYAVLLVNAKLDAIETFVGTSPILRIRTGAAPANIAAASSGTVLATLTLPSDWMNAAAAGAKTMLGTWADAAADASGTAAHFEIVKSDTTTRCIQGTVGTSASDMIVDSVSFTAGQAFSITAFTITGANI